MGILAGPRHERGGERLAPAGDRDGVGFNSSPGLSRLRKRRRDALSAGRRLRHRHAAIRGNRRGGAGAGIRHDKRRERRVGGISDELFGDRGLGERGGARRVGRIGNPGAAGRERPAVRAGCRNEFDGNKLVCGGTRSGKRRDRQQMDGGRPLRGLACNRRPIRGRGSSSGAGCCRERLGGSRSWRG